MVTTTAISSPLASLYVGDLDPAVTSEVLNREFACYGGVTSVRVCRNFNTGESLRYGYVNFVSFDQADEARKAMNHASLNGKRMRIMWSQRDPLKRKTGIGNLFVKGLDPSVDAAQLENLFAECGAVMSCKVAEDASGRSRGFGFVHMDSEEAAQLAIEALNGAPVSGNTKPLYVAKFVKKSARVGPAKESKCSNLYIKNIDQNITDDILRERFSEFGKVHSAVVMKDEQGKSKCFGFVSFQSPEHANKALEAMHRAQFGSKRIYVAVAQKKDERKELLKQRIAERDGCNENIKESTVYVSNLNYSVNDKLLWECFGRCGKIISTKLIPRNNSWSGGFGFVCFSSPYEAQKAVTMLNGTELHGMYLYVAIARERTLLTKRHPIPNYYATQYYYTPNGFQFAPYTMQGQYQLGQLPYANASWGKNPIYAPFYNQPAICANSENLNGAYYRVPKSGAYSYSWIRNQGLTSVY